MVKNKTGSSGAKAQAGSLGTRSRVRRAKIDAAQNDARRIALKLEVIKFPRRAFFDPVAQSQELLFALVGLFWSSLQCGPSRRC